MIRNIIRSFSKQPNMQQLKAALQNSLKDRRIQDLQKHIDDFHQMNKNPTQQDYSEFSKWFMTQYPPEMREKLQNYDNQEPMKAYDQIQKTMSQFKNQNYQGESQDNIEEYFKEAEFNAEDKHKRRS